MKLAAADGDVGMALPSVAAVAATAAVAVEERLTGAVTVAAGAVAYESRSHHWATT